MFERLATIRAITTAVATIVVAVALTVGAIALVVAARRTMVDEVTEAAGKQAAEVVRSTRVRSATRPRGRRQ